MIHRAIAFALMITCGLGFILYPQANEWFTTQQSLHTAYAVTQTGTPTVGAQAEIIENAKAYNAELARHIHRVTDPISYPDDDDYLGQLQFGMQAMSKLYIPKLDLELPIYHGTGPWELEHGAGHLYGSSLPVGGESTHTVVTAHAGIPGNELFTHLPELTIGDEFTFTTGWLQQTYRVTKIETVLPDEVESLRIVPGEDLATLITCTPIGINSHRLLVTGTRVADPVQPIAPAISLNFPWWALILGGGAIAAFLIGLLLFRAPAQTKRNKNARSQKATGRRAPIASQPAPVTLPVAIGGAQ